MRILFSLLVLFLSINCPAQTIRYVSAGSGNDSYSGWTTTSAFATLNKTQDNIGLSSGYNIIYVDEGVYNEGLEIDRYGGTSEVARFKYIVAPEKWGNSGVAQVGGAAVYGGIFAQSENLSYVTIQGFKILNGTSHGIFISGSGRTDYWNIFDCEIDGISKSATNVGININDASSYTKIYNCIVYNCGGRGVQLGGGAANSTGNLVYNCIISSCNTDGIRGRDAGQTVKNSIITNCKILVDDFVNGNITSNYNCLSLGTLGTYYGKDQGGSYNTMALWVARGEDANSIDAVPGYRDELNRHFQLTPLSSVIDKGLDIETVLTDINGIPRPKNYRYDIGVYEYDKVNVAGN